MPNKHGKVGAPDARGSAPTNRPQAKPCRTSTGRYSLRLRRAKLFRRGCTRRWRSHDATPSMDRAYRGTPPDRAALRDDLGHVAEMFQMMNKGGWV
jgi:hypothetical protein